MDIEKKLLAQKGMLKVLVEWIGVGSDWIGHELGEEALEKYFTEVASHQLNLMVEKAGKDPSKVMTLFYQSTDLLGNDMTYYEDSESIRVSGNCNTGGRMNRDGITKRFVSGKYQGMSPYCVHCLLWFNILLSSWHGIKVDFTYSADGTNCVFCFNKKTNGGKADV